jgi:hypothetical protein
MQSQFDAQVLLNQLFEVYGTVMDTEFRKYILRKNDENDVGTVVLTPKTFKKYQTRDTKKLWRLKNPKKNKKLST